MRNLINVGAKDDPLFIDAALVVVLMNDTKRYGTLIFMDGAQAPLSTPLDVGEVYGRLTDKKPETPVKLVT